MKEYILSAGIDIGTTTTQLVFSRLEIMNTGGVSDIPKIEIVGKEIIYRSEIYFTPLLSEEEIDAEGVKELILGEYKKAGMKPEELITGAIIITGESARKQNAEMVIHALSDIAGDFVVATAGPNLESVLAGKGSGAAKLSLESGELVGNLDIGGGTTNICYYRNGKVVDTACLDVGGRLIRVKEGKISYISKKIKLLLENEGIPLAMGEIIDPEDEYSMGKLIAAAECMVRVIEQSILLAPPTKNLELLKTNQLISCKLIPDTIVFSGGVSDCIKPTGEDKFVYGDIGILLGEAIYKSPLIQQKRNYNVEETIHATVIGAGSYSMEVSGCTIEYKNCLFPYKNIPVICFTMKQEHLDGLHTDIINAVKQFNDGEEKGRQIALASKGIKNPSFIQIEKIAEEIVMAINGVFDTKHILIIVIEEDIGKALGQAIKRLVPKGKALLCIDHIECHEGDYIDIGAPIASGTVVPVVVKTLIFNS